MHGAIESEQECISCVKGKICAGMKKEKEKHEPIHIF